MASVAKASSRNVELGYAELSADQTTTSTAADGVAFSPDLTVTAVVGSRPIVVEAGFEIVTNSGAGGSTLIHLMQDGVKIGTGTGRSGAANEAIACRVKRRLSLAAGTYVFTLNKAVSAGTGTFFVSFGSKGYLQVVEV